MSSLADTLRHPGVQRAFLMGNHALVRAMLEAGIRVATTYPGSPTPEIAAALESLPSEERSYHFEYATNEKVASEIAIGAALNGQLACVFFKSVGLNVAADSLIQLSLLPLSGGLVVVLGDDPGANSSQNEQDNRHFARMAYLPLFEPATPQEAYEMFVDAAQLARAEATAVLFRMTTHVCHAKELIELRAFPDTPPGDASEFVKDPSLYVPVAKTVLPMKRRALERLERLAAYAETSRHQRLEPAGGRSASPRTRPASSRSRPASPRSRPVSSRGVIASGLPALSVREVGAACRMPFDLLVLGFSHPLPKRRIADFLRAHEEVLVVEELDRVLEQEVKTIAFDAAIDVRLRSREGADELVDEYGADRVRALLHRVWPDLELPVPPRREMAAGPSAGVCGWPARGSGHSADPSSPSAGASGLPEPVPRIPQMCPGCGHRSAFFAISKALSPETVTVADIGCHTMGFERPHRLGDVLLSMGHSTATAAGFALRKNGPKPVAFVGDSTMIHAALPAIADAAVHDHAVTLILLENGTTAMTGHQPRAGSGEVGGKLDVKRILESLGVAFLRDVDAYQQAKLTEMVREAQAHPGFAVVIARHPCMLKMMRETRRRRPGFKVRPVAIDPEACDRLYTCLREFGCPTFVYQEDGSVSVEEDLCIGDGSCLQTCPVSAIGRPQRGDAS